MTSEDYSVPGRVAGKKPVLRGAERLVMQHGDKADLIAARLADACFRAGDEIAGNHWTKIFRVLARSQLRHLRERLGTAAIAAIPGDRVNSG